MGVDHKTEVNYTQGNKTNKTSIFYVHVHAYYINI